MADAADSALRKIRFDYIKSNLFRVIHADGAHGGVTTNGLIQMAVYSERLPIPQSTVHELKADGTLSEEIRDERVARQAIIREVEVEVLLNSATAKALLKWLTDQVALLEGNQPSSEGQK